MGSLILLMMIYPLSIFLPRQRCPHCNKWFSLPKLVDQKGDRERVQCRSCNHVWERFSYRGGVSSGGDGGGDGGGGEGGGEGGGGEGGGEGGAADAETEDSQRCREVESKPEEILEDIKRNSQPGGKREAIEMN